MLLDWNVNKKSAIARRIDFNNKRKRRTRRTKLFKTSTRSSERFFKLWSKKKFYRFIKLNLWLWWQNSRCARESLHFLPSRNRNSMLAHNMIDELIEGGGEGVNSNPPSPTRMYGWTDKCRPKHYQPSACNVSNS